MERLNETDAAAQARAMVILAFENGGTCEDAEFAAYLDALIAAVRAECAAKVRGVVEEMREQMQTGLPQFDGQTMCCDDCTHKALNHLTASLATLEAQ